MFEEQVAKDRKSVVQGKSVDLGGRRIIEKLANITANSLIEKGLEKGGKVLILLERTSKFFTSLFGNRPLSDLLLLGSGRIFVLTLPFGVRGISSS